MSHKSVVEMYLISVVRDSRIFKNQFHNCCLLMNKLNRQKYELVSWHGPAFIQVNLEWNRVEEENWQNLTGLRQIGSTSACAIIYFSRAWKRYFQEYTFNALGLSHFLV